MPTIILDCSQLIFFTNFRFPYEMMPQGSNGSRLMKASRHRATLVQEAGMLLHTFCKVAIYKRYLQMPTIILDCSQLIFFTNFRFPYEMMPQGSNGSRLMKASRHRATLVQEAGMLLHTFCKVAIYKHYRTHQKTFQLASSPRPKSIH